MDETFEIGPRRRRDHRLASQMLGPGPILAEYEGDAAKFKRGELKAAGDFAFESILRPGLDITAQRNTEMSAAEHMG